MNSMTSSREPDWRSVRADYPALAGRAYLDTACKGIPSSEAVDAISDHLDRLRRSPAASTTHETIHMLEQFERARKAAAALIGAHPQEIALVPSTEAGLAAVASALVFERGTNIVASELEFIGTVLPWRYLAGKGLELRLVPHRDGRIDLADLDAVIDRRTRAVVVSAVQEVNGYRTDLDQLSHLCRQRSVLLIVDGIQHVGPIRLDVRTTSIDALAVGGHKWLCAPFGMGFLYVSKRIIDQIEPSTRSFMTATPAAGDWTRYLESPDRGPGDHLDFPHDARKLESGALGTTLAAAGLAAALETLLRLGPSAVAARSRQLVELTAKALREAGMEIVTPTAAEPSSIITFRSTREIDRERALVATLAGDGILTSLRFTSGVGGIRISPYFYNDAEDVERLKAALQQHRASAA